MKINVAYMVSGSRVRDQHHLTMTKCAALIVRLTEALPIVRITDIREGQMGNRFLSLNIWLNETLKTPQKTCFKARS